MRYSKKIAAAALGLLCVMMSACQSRTTPVSATTVATMPEAQTKATVSAVQTQGTEELTHLLDQIEENVFPGTAGCTLTSVPYTAKLLDWCKSTGISENEMVAALNAWKQGKDGREIARKFELIRDTYETLIGDHAQELMNNAGYETDSYPWPQSCTQIMNTLLTTLGAEETTSSPA